MENEKPKAEKRIFLNEIVKDELTYLQLLAEKKKIQLNVEYRDELYFKIDKESFVRLIHNLVSNAIKYNRVGGSIEVVVEQSKITVSDTGIGIAKEHQKEIYERFYRASSEVGGFGLGLNIVHKVCKAYNIEISLHSKLNEGSTFVLIFKEES